MWRKISLAPLIILNIQSTDVNIRKGRATQLVKESMCTQGLYEACMCDVCTQSMYDACVHIPDTASFINSYVAHLHNTLNSTAPRVKPP